MSMNTFDIELDQAGLFRMEPDWLLLLVPQGRAGLSDWEYEKAASRLCDLGYKFLYLPKLASTLPVELLNYYIPECKGANLPGAEALQNRIVGELGVVVHSPLAVLFNDWKFHCIESLEGDETISDFLASLYSYLDSECAELDDIRFSIPCMDFAEECTESMPDIEPSLSRKLGRPRCFSFGTCMEMAMAEEGAAERDAGINEYFSLESLIRELQMVNESKLRELGLSEDALRFLMGNVIPKVSRMRISRHARIILDDYDGLEIKLDDKTKALYFLFIRHPEGIAIKDLPQHIDELMDLYQSISGRDDPTAMRRTIENLADPFQNNANISLSRIKKAFCEAFTPSLACKYYVEGERGGLRRVSLDRSLVIWETIR